MYSALPCRDVITVIKTTVCGSSSLNIFVYLFTVLQDRDETLIEAQLFVREARPEAFRKYTLVAENNVAIATSDVELLQSNNYY